MLLSAMAFPGVTAAHYAAIGQHREVFDLLMERGADATIADEFGKTPPQKWASSAEEEGEH